MEIQPVTNTIGAELPGIDLGAVDSREIHSIQNALGKHKVLFFKQQHMNLDEFCTFSEKFGPLMKIPYITPMKDYPYVIAVLKEASETNMGVFGGDWHSDFSFLETPPMYSILYSNQVPAVGGDTLWVNMAAAYQGLPDKMKQFLNGKSVIHTGKPYGVKNAPPREAQFTGSISMDRNNPEADRETEHPAVCRHPDTEEAMLFISPTYTSRFSEMSESESAPLLRDLYEHCTRPEFSCRVRWQSNMIAIWDNRSTMHYAVNDYDGSRRLLYRTTTSGHKPVAYLQ